MEATLLAHLFTIKELNAYGVMCTDVCILHNYHDLFYIMEATGMLDPSDNADLFLLHSIYLSKINKSLLDFARAWNHHPIGTNRNRSSRQIIFIRESDAQSNIEIIPSDFGVDYK